MTRAWQVPSVFNWTSQTMFLNDRAWQIGTSDRLSNLRWLTFPSTLYFQCSILKFHICKCKHIRRQTFLILCCFTICRVVRVSLSIDQIYDILASLTRPLHQSKDIRWVFYRSRSLSIDQYIHLQWSVLQDIPLSLCRNLQLPGPAKIKRCR